MAVQMAPGVNQNSL